MTAHDTVDVDLDTRTVGDAPLLSSGPPGPHRPRRSRALSRSWTIIWGGVAVIAIVVTAIILSVGAGVAGTAVMPSTLTVSGIVMITDYDGFTGHTTGKSCAGDGGYDDLALGTSVSVLDSKDSIVGEGFIDTTNFNGSSCVMSFTIADVPTGSGFYQVEIGSRDGKIVADEKDAELGVLYFIGEIG